ncbi:TRAP dicarboxylate transporter subunit DctP [Sulfuricella denitrificans skB26]|uniref:TRAP dicarboxylate transporter subunit DctP n=1 Tax=Sulfuricella denitrificans (strain DSM 22764 / NBRC 105220 / skB26) TaxID=1163617 RepID=S6AAC7_SULDS|nr:TRAP transporter substrate-binding protein [Sulfuricella denitrificans]BAN35630.1 TRAP dicarboxylate transporter subunit DctP [Sulfuricella denitrificans skB26]
MKIRTAMMFILALGVSTLANAAGEIVIKFSHVVAPDTPKGRAAEKFKQLAEEKTKGKVKVEIYPNSQLYKDREEIEALQIGAVQMLAPSLSKFGPMGAREFEVFDLPYIFPNKETLYRVMDGDVGKKLFAKLESKGVMGLTFWDNGFKQMSANRPLINVADFKGLKMRIQSSKVLDATMKALGANPQVMAFSEVYTGLQQGVVDGTENPVSNFYTQKMNEVQKYMTISQHNYLGYAVVVNKKFWEGLPVDVRTALESAMKETTAFERDIAQQENDEALAKVKAAKTTDIHYQSPKERLDWYKALLPVHKEFEDVIGKDIIQAVYSTASQVEKELVKK